MKIKRFNESGLNTSNWSLEKIKKHFDDRSSVEKDGKQLIDYLEFYLYYNPDLLPTDEFVIEVEKVKKNILKK